MTLFLAAPFRPPAEPLSPPPPPVLKIGFQSRRLAKLFSVFSSSPMLIQQWNTLYTGISLNISVTKLSSAYHYHRNGSISANFGALQAIALKFCMQTLLMSRYSALLKIFHFSAYRRSVSIGTNFGALQAISLKFGMQTCLMSRLMSVYWRSNKRAVGVRSNKCTVY